MLLGQRGALALDRFALRGKPRGFRLLCDGRRVQLAQLVERRASRGLGLAGQFGETRQIDHERFQILDLHRDDVGGAADHAHGDRADIVDVLADRRDAPLLGFELRALLCLAGFIPLVAHGDQAVFLGLGDGDQALLFGDDRLRERVRVVARRLRCLLDVGARRAQHHRCAVHLVARCGVLDLDHVSRLRDELAQGRLALGGRQRDCSALDDGQFGGLLVAHVRLLVVG